MPATFRARPRARRLARTCLALAALAAAARAGAAEAPPGTLTLDAAIARALAHDPAIAAARHDVRAAASGVRVAERRPPARIAVDLENWGGPERAPGVEVTAGLGWTLELGGDRAARRAGAGALAEGADAALAQARRDVRASVTADFVAAWAARERVAVLEAARDQALAAARAARERLREGASPAVEVARAESEVARAEAQLVLERGAAAAAAGALALHWPGQEPAGDSLELPEPSLAAVAAPRADGTLPGLAVAVAGERGAAAELRGAVARRVPDLDVSLGVRRFADERASGFVAGFSLPLGAGSPAEVDAARARLARATLERETVTRRARADARAAAARLEAALAAWRHLDGVAGPRAGEALELLVAGYRAGRFGYVDLVEGRRAALAAREARIEAAAAVWRARAELERLTGAPEARPNGEATR